VSYLWQWQTARINLTTMLYNSERPMFSCDHFINRPTWPNGALK